MSQLAKTPSPDGRPAGTREAVPPLEHGDFLTDEEFIRRWEAMPDLKRAERLDGMVFLAAEYRGRIIDPTIPPLENGDKLTWEEFQRRWENMPDLKKAERINGMVFMPPPVSVTRHGIPHSDLILWLGTYRASTPGVMLSDNGTVRIRPDVDVQPDATLFVPVERGGATRLDDKGYILGAPEFVAEVAATSASFDLHWKLDIYRGAGVREYLVWRVDDRAIDWLVLRNDRYEPLVRGADGLLRSETFPGLWLEPSVLVAGDVAAVLRVVQQGVASLEHAAFATRLATAPARGP